MIMCISIIKISSRNGLKRAMYLPRLTDKPYLSP
jgi:hypothetical protein